MAIAVFTAPTVEPLSTAEAKSHLRVTSSDDDTLIDSYVASARDVFQDVTHRALLTQTLEYSFEYWPSGRVLELPRPPLQSVSSVTYTDSDGASQTLATTEYAIDTRSVVGGIVLGKDKTWPSLDDIANAVVVQYVAGYGAAASAVPATILQAIRFLVAQFYEVREPVVVGSTASDIPETWQRVLWPHRVGVIDPIA